MADIKSFLRANRVEQETTKKVKLKSFAEPFVISTITEKENDVLKVQATSKRRNKSGNMISDLDTDKYSDLLVAKCVVSPDLENAELQQDWGTPGDDIGTLKAMTLAGEYATLTKEIIDFNGFNEDFDDLKEEVKK